VDSSNKDASAAVVNSNTVWTTEKDTKDKLTVRLNAAEVPMLSEVSLTVKSASMVTLTAYSETTVNSKPILEVR